MKKLLIILILFSLALAACETVKGAGKDMQKAGSWIEEKAEKAK